ncbi:hypothetical protein A3841_16310 [Pontibacter flavimaris]|uniref:Uncharacterized protein n=1 Tax=Pontibacter flavimaris TaxID=1797110 RepID=A0A1Q5PCL4_9BACT|nr:hypothetical protein A3841_16310 [Pontibacter flavimaris]
MLAAADPPVPTNLQLHFRLWLPPSREGSSFGIALCSLLRQGAALAGHRISQGAQPKDWYQFDSHCFSDGASISGSDFILCLFYPQLQSLSFEIPDRFLALLGMTVEYSKYKSPLGRGWGEIYTL